MVSTNHQYSQLQKHKKEYYGKLLEYISHDKIWSQILPSKAGPHYGMVNIQEVSCYVYDYGCEETIELFSGIGIFKGKKEEKLIRKL